MNLAFADRDFYYGDPVLSARGADPGPALEGLRRGPAQADRLGAERPDGPARRPVPVPGRQKNPYLAAAREVGNARGVEAAARQPPRRRRLTLDESFRPGTTSILAADEEGWVVSITPSGGWVPAFIAGNTGIGLSQRMQSFVLDAGQNPFNVLGPGQAAAGHADAQPGAEGRQAVSRLRGAGRRHAGPEPAAVLPERGGVRDERAGGRRGPEHQQLPDAQLVRRSRVRARPADACTPARRRGCGPSSGRWATRSRSRSAPPARSTRSYFDPPHGTMWGGSSDHGEDYGIGW